ncbi:glycosyltransferase family 4 protein [Psychromonas hadalis]|uniref:glycosyltransferase family 4 protein n=1 Tax=Psychromonas hadalis TaxID=211669 RepID=UPI0003B751C4|nr:glycosyltransferase family 4 protein [Psychromonas hadalis]
MKILILSFYYKPDLCAGSFRCTALIDELKKIKGCEIELITTMPNRYSSFEVKALEFEQNGPLTIHRIPLPSHKSGMLDQIKSFATYYNQARKKTRKNDYDLVFATSSRLFTAFLGTRIATKKDIPIYLDIRDIFVDTIKDVLSPKLAFFIRPLFSIVEKYTFRKSLRINLVSKGFLDYFSQRFPCAELRFFTNGIDEEFIDLPTAKLSDASARKIKILYAGNIGEGQGLHNIIPKLAKALSGQAEFVVIGDGGRRIQLESELMNDTNNVTLLPPMGRGELIEQYLQADILFLHLNDYPAFKKVLPSKIFEYAAMGKPILAGVSGYSASFLRDKVSNAQVFNPVDINGAVSAFNKLDIVHTPRNEFIEKYRRRSIMKEMALDIVNIFESNRIKK